jgi:hypothetical protein
MAKVRMKKNKRYRVQITTSKEVWEKYISNQQLAGEMKAEIDFSAEFTVWFARQNEQVALELQLLKKQQAEVPSAVVKQEKTVGNEMATHNVLAVTVGEVTCTKMHENADATVLFDAEAEDDGDDNF